ncbi:MAG: DNA-directed RNA polymerase subunit alpha [Candidatus Vogelbacteria bacterium]|nr:DNA-directed RNA polymerase subunit alpha [Candidatus Vogelbacteria bacterium]
MTDFNIILPSKPKILNEDNFRGAYEIEGLYPGYGHTLGNSLRRVILSSLAGTAITSVKIDGVTHEFSTLAGVKEDAIMIILALKKVRFIMIGDEPKKASLKIKGAKTVTAGDIETGGQLEAMNPDLPIATLTDKGATLNIEMTVERGLGYMSKEMIQKDRSEIGTIYLDAIFTPIRRASYEVENMRVGDRTDYNRLRFTIETDGTITPHDALEKSVNIMIHQLQAIVGFKEPKAEPEAAVGEEMGEKETSGPAKKEQSEALKTRIEDLDLSTRTQKALAGEGIRTVGGLARKKEEDVLAIAGMGEKGLQEIKKALGNLGLNLKQ